MSRIGKLPITIPQGVKVELNNNLLKIKGPKGELVQKIHPLVIVNISDKEIRVDIKNKSNKNEKSLWGTFRKLIDNMVKGVTQGYQKQLEINGVGYKVKVEKDNLILNVGYSHPVNFQLPKGIDASQEKNIITISGIDKQLVGDTSAKIRRIRKPEPYKGKGIKYVDEVIRRKQGKTNVKEG